MLFFRQLQLVKCLFQTFFYLSIVFCLCQAGIIKKRETQLNSISGNITEPQPTILTAVASGNFNGKEVVTTKLQSVVGSTFSTESSKELTNNEILINEAKKLLEEEEKIINTNNETELKAYKGKENDPETIKENEQQTDDNIKDIKEIIKNLEYKEQNLSETLKSSIEIDKNDVKEDRKEDKLYSNQQEGNSKSEEKQLKEPENYSIHSSENSLKPSGVKPNLSSKILTGFEINEDAVLKTKVDSSLDKNAAHEEHFIAPSKQRGILKLEGNEKAEDEVPKQKQIILKDNREKDLLKFENSESSVNLQNSKLEPSNTVKNHEEKTIDQKENFVENQKDKVPLNLDALKHVRPIENSNSNFNQDELSHKIKANFTENFIDDVQTTIANNAENLNSNKKILNNVHDSIEGEINNLGITPTTLTPESDRNLPIFEGAKNLYTHSMGIDNSTTLKPTDLSIKEDVEQTNKTAKNVYLEKDNLQSVLNFKEKKPKFINDNSTNAQQLNLPNNAEVWSLAAMKTLPKSNISLETTQAHTQTFNDSKTEKENNETKRPETHNITSTTMMSNISEKNLLDWYQIMMDKELSTTTGMEEYKPEDANRLEISNSTFSRIKMNEEKDQIISIPSATTTLATILSFANDDNNSVADKKVKENVNNHMKLLKETQETQETTIATTTTDANLPPNAITNTEPNLNEKINLTLKQNTLDMPIINTTAANNAENPTVDGAEASTIASTTTTAIEATAVDMTTAVVEQYSSETTTVSTLETSKQNTTSSTGDVIKPQQKIYNFIKNINEIEEEFENTLKENQTNDDFNLKSIILTTSKTIPTTTTVVPITTFRPSILAITATTSSTSTPSTKFEQEIDKNGNEIKTNLNENKQIQKQQSILLAAEATTATATTENLYDIYSSTKTIETHLEAKQYEATTLETITEKSTTPLTDLVEKEDKEENIELENTTSFSFEKEENQEKEIQSVKSESELEKTEITETTPKSDDETTIGSPVIVPSTLGYNGKGNTKEFEIETTTAAAVADTTKTPVVVIETQSVINVPTESSTTTAVTTTTTSTTTTTTTEESVTETVTRAIKQEESEINTKEEDKETIRKNNDNHETSTKITPDMSKSTTIITTAAEETTKATATKTMTTAKDEETFISLLDDTTTTTTYSPTPTMEMITSSTMATFTTTPQTMTTTTPAEPSAITTKIEEIYDVINSTTTEFIQTTTTHLNAEIEESSSTESSATTTTPSTNQMFPPTSDINKSLPTLTSIMGGNSGNIYPKNTEASKETDVNVIIAITVSVIGVVALILLVGFLYIMRKRQKQTSYSQRCRPVSLDEYTIDNVSVSGSMRKSSALRSSKRTYGNLAFDDPSLRHNPMGVHELAKFVQEKLRIFEEFRDVPQITSRLDEVPPGCEDKNRYANVLPLPETRVILQRLNNDDKTEYINANYITGPKDPPNYYIACQAPLDSTVEDFWRMIWEQQSRVIIQATDLIENGVEKCAEYLPPSVTLDNHSTFGDYQITLQNREVKDKYAISTILLKNVVENATRELTHYWYKWPEVGVPNEEAPIIAMLLEARSSLISYAIEQANEDKEKSSTATLRSAEEGTVSSINGSITSPANNSNVSSANGSSGEINGNISMVQIKKTARNQGPLTVHCSPGTGRTGTIIACDIAIRSLETPKRTVDIPQIVYYVRRGRASAVLTKEQYEFIYKVANMYAAKITNPTSYN